MTASGSRTSKCFIASLVWLSETYAAASNHPIGSEGFDRYPSQTTLVLHDVAEGREIIIALVAVHTVVYGNEADVMLWKISVSIVANLQIVTAQPGHILYNYGGHITGLYILQHLLKAGTVEVCPGIAIINIEPCVGKMMLFCVLGEQFFLRSDLSRVFSPFWCFEYHSHETISGVSISHFLKLNYDCPITCFGTVHCYHQIYKILAK